MFLNDLDGQYGIDHDIYSLFVNSGYTHKDLKGRSGIKPANLLN